MSTDIAAAEARGDMMAEELAYRRLPRAIELLFAALTVFGTVMVLNQMANLQFFAGITILENRYLFLLAAFFLGLVFLAYPARPATMRDVPSWIDWVLFALSAAVPIWFAVNAERALNGGWEYAAPVEAQVMAGILVLLVIEATRRAGGLVLACVVALVALYPVVADKMPGPIAGLAQPLTTTVTNHILSNESAFGIPMRAFGELVVGFIIFGVALNYTGGGKFFNDVAFALVGRFRGGAAQVGVISSGLQGSISGSVISNVISSGVVTIPAMMRTGFERRYAAGVEAVASTGGVLMPPVMGSTAFVMAGFLGTPYSNIAVAAAVPALLFYFGLAMQIDAYAARRGLKGLPASELPSLGQTFKEGWTYIVVFAVLAYFLLAESDEALAPFYATAVLFVVNQFDPRHRFTPAKFLAFLTACGRSLAELIAILLGVGLIVGAFSVTGLAGTLANDLVFLAGNKVLALLVMGALTSFVFGMGMTATACYIFLAITLAPALTKAGLDPMAVHLFIFYWGMVSFITPPVALGSFAAATIARANPFQVGLVSMRLGSVIYIVPFLFVLNPALILKGTPFEIAEAIVTAAVGIVLICAALQGYLLGIGRIPDGFGGAAIRLALAFAGLCIALPSDRVFGLDHAHWQLVAVGAAVAGIAAFLIRRMDARQAPAVRAT
ncbi:TRAP transporter permease [Salinarimonas soli]|uniref:TRAP transporter fused permease subunit n=1 Tax=Salinarimonas soli TaxID=1638099 RepID=A0A5B2VFV4_9HYPH|nr:TRAP transporter fused permease subunit [Salinarimonas soli]KAA2237745.1 TRAP transporter fused permease subunit [Salinarimonas soli]